MPTVETAHFRADDADVLVAASLSCSSCLSSDVEWALGGEAFDAHVVVACTDCAHERRVYLEPMQELRLSLHGDGPLDRSLRPGLAPGLQL